MKIYTYMNQENEEPQLITFELDIARAADAIRCCKLYDYNEVVLTMPDYERLPWPEVLPTDGFISAEMRAEFEAGRFEPQEEVDDDYGVDLTKSLQEGLHIGRNGAIHAEMSGGPAGTWWSEGLDFEEVDAHAQATAG